MTAATVATVAAMRPPATATSACPTSSTYPTTLTVAVGDTVTWASVDSPDHTVTADDDSFDSGTLSNGDTFDHTFDEAGEYAYHCEIHSSMTGTITVE